MNICLYVNSDIDVNLYKELPFIDKIVHFIFYDKDYIELNLHTTNYEKKNNEIDDKLLFYVNKETNQELYFVFHYDILYFLLKKVNYIFIGNVDLPLIYLKHIKTPTFKLIGNIKYFYCYENNFNLLNRSHLLFHLYNDNTISEKCNEYILMDENNIYYFPDSFKFTFMVSKLKNIEY